VREGLPGYTLVNWQPNLNRYNLTVEEVGEMKIILGTFKDNADELAEFLGPRLGVKAEIGGGELNFEDGDVKKTVKSRHVKTYVKRFLNKKGERANYQIQVEGKQLRLIELERDEEEEEKEEKKTSPKIEEKASEKVPDTEAEEKEEKVDAAEAGAAKEEEEARSVNKEEEKKEGALDAGAVKKQTKPRTKKKSS